MEEEVAERGEEARRRLEEPTDRHPAEMAHLREGGTRSSRGAPSGRSIVAACKRRWTLRRRRREDPGMRPDPVCRSGHEARRKQVQSSTS